MLFWELKCRVGFTLFNSFVSCFSFMNNVLCKLNRLFKLGSLLMLERLIRTFSYSCTYFLCKIFSFIFFILYQVIMDRKMNGEDISTNEIVQVSNFLPMSLNIVFYCVLRFYP